MIISGGERSTGMGATFFTAVLNGKWIRLSKCPEVRYLGREHGVEMYELLAPESSLWANFTRSNSGREGVVVMKGTEFVCEFHSFEEAHRWAVEQSVAVVIVTRHAGLVEWLGQHNIVGPVIAQATLGDVIGKHVVGALPLHLAVEAERVTVVDMPGLAAEQRGKDLTPAEMDAAGAKLTSYRIVKL